MSDDGRGIPASVAYQARYPGASAPEPLPESGATRVVRPGYCLLMTPLPTVNYVEDVRLPPTALADAVAEVRQLLRERGREQAAWVVPASAADQLAALAAVGMTPYQDPPLEPRSTAMALVRPPAGSASPGVVVREAVTLEDYLATGELAAELFDMNELDRDGLVAAMRVRHTLREQGRTPVRTYLATVDDRLVGQAQGIETPTGTNLSGSSVLPSARGRGVYRAMIAARWEDAVRRGLPALTVQAGEMSQPILQRLGFEVVEVQAILCDRFGPGA